MAISDAALWHQVHAERDDGVATTFLVRDIEPRLDQPRIFVIQLPYPITDLSKLPDAASSRRLDTFQEQWVEPACEALGWTLVASKIEDGSFFLYLYGDGDPQALLEKLAPFDGALGFYSDVDADWSEYAALRELVERAEADAEGHVHSESCEHGVEYGTDEISDGVPVGIPVVDLSGDPPPPPRRASARAPTVDLRKPRASRPAKPQASKARAPAKAASKPRAAKATSKPKATKPKAAKPKAAAAKPARGRTATKPARPTTKTASSKRSATRSKPRASRR
jgi:hypothetical protein